MRRHTGAIRNTRSGFSLSDVLVVLVVATLLLAVTLPLLAANTGGMGVAGSKRNLMQLHMAHQMYAADYNGNQWVNAPHDLATFGDTYADAMDNWIDSIGGTSHPMVNSFTGQWMTILGWAVDPDNGSVGNWLFPWNVYTMPVHLDGSISSGFKGFGYYRMMNTRGFTQYVNGKVYDRTFFAPRHGAALAAVGECFGEAHEFCLGDDLSVFWPTSYSLSPAALFHPEMWNVPEDEFPTSMDDVFAQFGNAFEALPYTSAKYPDLKTHISEHAWLQNNTAGPCNPDYPNFALDSYDGCQSWKFNASIHSAPVTLFYDGHVRLLPLTEVKQADDQIGVWRRDTPMGQFGYFGEFDPPGEDGPNLSHHILTNGGILGRDTLGQ